VRDYQNASNMAMSSCRERVEWALGRYSPVGICGQEKSAENSQDMGGDAFMVAMLVTNIHTCLCGSETSLELDSFLCNLGARYEGLFPGPHPPIDSDVPPHGRNQLPTVNTGMHQVMEVPLLLSDHIPFISVRLDSAQPKAVVPHTLGPHYPTPWPR
jgi:hypothetical protein